MNQEADFTFSALPPRAVVSTHSRSPLALIWIVPAIAVLIAIGLGVNAILTRGPEITIRFSSAEGLEANKTKVKYKDVDIGKVTSIALGDNRKSVNVTVAMDRQAAALLVADSRFWVVRPRIGAGGISGLNTVLSGAYIAIDPGSSEEARHGFVGLDAPPLVVSGMLGRQFLLTAEDLGSLDVGAPVYYRRIPVGRVVGYAMRPDGEAVDVRIFIDAPYDRFVTAGSRFWHASGIDVSLNADGLKMETQSLVSLAVGGIALGDLTEDANDGVPQAPAESRFTLHADRAAALRLPDSVVTKYLLVFDESVRGLAVGSPVDFRGITAGEVSRIDLEFRRDTADIAMAVEINLYPERFARRWRSRSTAPTSERNPRPILDGMVARGLRAQLRTGNLLTGQRYVALDFFPKAKAAQVKWGRAIPQFPTQRGALDGLEDQLQSVMEALQKTLQHTDKLIADVDQTVVPQLATSIAEATKTLDAANGVLAADSPTQLQLRDTLREVERAAASVRNLADLLERHPEALITGKKAIP